MQPAAVQSLHPPNDHHPPMKLLARLGGSLNGLWFSIENKRTLFLILKGSPIGFNRTNYVFVICFFGNAPSSPLATASYVDKEVFMWILLPGYKMSSQYN